MIAVLALTCALFSMVLAVLALAPMVDAGANRLRLGKRVAALPGKLQLLPHRSAAASKKGGPKKGGAIRRSTAAPLLRDGGRVREAMLRRWLPGSARIEARLEAAGGKWSLTRLVAVCGLASVAAVTLGGALGLPDLAAVLLVPVLTIGGAGLSSGVMFARAQAAFAKDFAGALAMIIRSLRAGLPVAAAINEVARTGTGPVARTLSKAEEEMRLGQPLEIALWAAARKISVADFDFFVVTVSLQRETGGNLAETLLELDDTLRMRRQQALKIKAMAAEARASAMIIGSLPFAMGGLLWMTSPEYLSPLFTTSMGRAMIGAGLVSMGVGALVIRELMAIKA